MSQALINKRKVIKSQLTIFKRYLDKFFNPDGIFTRMELRILPID